MNTSYSLGGAFGVADDQAFIVSGSEDGDVLFWDVSTKEIVQRSKGHDGAVCWVDTCPGSGGPIVSGGLDGTVRIWVHVDEDEGDVNGFRNLKVRHRKNEESDAEELLDENSHSASRPAYEDTHMDDGSEEGERTPGRDIEGRGGSDTPDVIEGD